VKKPWSPEPLLLLFAVLGALLLLFIAVPIAATVAIERPSSIFDALGQSDVRAAISVSFGAALISTGFSCLFGIPLAYVLARVDFRGKGVVQSIMDVPIVIPHTIAGITLLVVFGRAGLFSGQMNALGLHIEDNLLGIVIAMMFVSAPLVVNSAREGFERVDERLENVARTLGASKGDAFLTVAMPLSLSSIFTGAIMSWARAVSEFGAVVIIAYFPKTIPTLIYERNLHSGLSESLPLTALMIIIVVGIFVALRVLIGLWKRRMEEA
jgi:molybdate/tungstate transport system permease protein